MSEEGSLVGIFSNAAFYDSIREALLKRRLFTRESNEDVSKTSADGDEEARDLLEAFVDHETIVTEQTLRPIVRKYILSQLPNPPFITYEDFEEDVFTYLGGKQGRGLDAGLRHLAAELKYKCQRFCSQFREPPDVEFDFGDWTVHDRDEQEYPSEKQGYPPEGKDGAAVWASLFQDKGFELKPQWLPHKRCSYLSNCALILTGNCTPHAFCAAQRQFEILIPWVRKSVRMLLAKLYPEEFGAYELPAGLQNPDVQHPRWPLAVRFGIPFLGECLAAYFFEGPKNTDNTEQRLRNAVHLLVEADRQEMPAIGLSLCFSAIEALVCRKSQGIVDELSRNVATLLQRNSRDRRQTSRAIVRLYDLRCKAMHGERLANDYPAWTGARVLATAVLAAVLEWKKYQLRVGDSTERRTFLDELENAERSGALFVGPSERLAACLPD